MKAPFLLLAIAPFSFAQYCPPQWLGNGPFCNTLGGCPSECVVTATSNDGCWFGSYKQLCDCCGRQSTCIGSYTSCSWFQQTCCSSGQQLGWCIGWWGCPNGDDFNSTFSGGNLTSSDGNTTFPEGNITFPDANFTSLGGTSTTLGGH